MGRLYFFGDNARADLFGLDPADVRDRRRHEYGVYILGHGAEGTDFLAASSAKFAEWYCLGDGCLRYWGLEEWPFDEPRRSFSPSL